MIKGFVRTLLVGLAVAAAAHSAQAGVIGIPGTETMKGLLGANDRGDILWSTRSDTGLTLSTKDASGVYTHTVIDATVAGKGWAYSTLSSNGDAAWIGVDPVTKVSNIYHWDATTRTARALTSHTANPFIYGAAPQISANGSTAWFGFLPVCSYCNSISSLEYFDKPTGQVLRVTTSSRYFGLPVAMNRRNDAYWLEQAGDGAWEIRKFDSVARAVSTLTRRPIGTGGTGNPVSFNLVANDFGDLVWTEVVAGTSQVDVFMFDQRANAVRRITNTPGQKYATRINAAGDIAWKTDAQVWLYDQRSESAILVNPQSDYYEGLALNDMGEVAYSYHRSDYVNEMNLYKRATGVSTRVRPGVTNAMELDATLSGSGDLFFTSKWGGDWKEGQIVRATRDFTCN